MGYHLSIQWQYIPRSLAAPDAWLAIFVAAFLQYRQRRRQRRHREENRDKFHNIGAKSKPKFNGIWSLGHQWLLTNLRMFVSPLPSQATDLNAGMVDLQSDKDLAKLAKEIESSSGGSKKKTTKNASVQKSSTCGEMEIRSRRILKGELVYDDHFPLLETTLNLSLAVMVGLASRWILGLLRALRLSLISSEQSSLTGRSGLCCSPYTGGEDDHPGSFEKLLACVLIKKEGDDAGNFLLTMLMLAFLMNVIQLAKSVSSNHDTNAGDDNVRVEKIGRAGADAQIYRRVHPQKTRRVLVGCGAVLSSFWLFHTPVLLRSLGLDGLTEAMEELSARILLFGSLSGIISVPRLGSLGDVETIKNVCCAILALAWGYAASVMMIPIEETARNAAHIMIMSPSPVKKKLNPSEMMDLINVRMMLIIQAVTPVLIMCTYFLNNHFVDSMKQSARGGQRKMTFSKQYLQNSGLYVRIVLAWCFLAACAYCFRSLLQSYLDQATSVASAMGMKGEGVAKDDASNRRGTSQTTCRLSDPFNDRYKNIVQTAGRIVAFPALMFGFLAVAHILGGDGTTHPGIGYQSQPLNAPRSSIPGDGLLPPYSNRYMTWTFNQHHSLRGDAGSRAGEGLIQVASFFLSDINENPFRDAAQTTIARWLGNNRFCSPPKVRSVKSLIRHVQFILDETYGEDIAAKPAKTGRELLELAPKVTLIGTILGSKSAQGRCESEEDPGDTFSGEICETSIESNSSLQRPSFFDMLVFLISHQLFTPTVVSPIIDTVALLCSMWWSYWYSFKLVLYYSKIRHLMIH